MITMLTSAMDQPSLFQGLTPAQTALLEPILEPRSYCQDEVIFEQGEPAQYLYIVIEGEILVRYKAYDGPVITVAHVNPGNVCGWSAALERPFYTSGAVCITDCKVYRITGKALHQMCDENPDTGVIILERLANSIAERLSSTHGQVLDMLTHSPDGNGRCQRRISKNGNE